MSVVAAEWGTGQVFWSFLWFFLFFIWIWLLIIVFSDIFRSHDLSGWGKALWSIFIIFVPYLGVFVYLIARGHKMSEHAAGRGPGAGRGVQAVRAAGCRHGRWREHGRRARASLQAARAGHPRRRRVRPGQGQGARLTPWRRRTLGRDEHPAVRVVADADHQ